MAFTEELLDVPADVPPQAQTGLPAMAAEYGGGVMGPPEPPPPAVTPTEALTDAAYGAAAPAYRNLQAANTVAPQPGLASRFAAQLPGAQGVSDILSGLLVGGATKDPLAGAKLVANRQAAERQARTAMAAQANADIAFLDKLKTVAVQHRPALAADYFGKQGRQVPGSILNMLSDQEILTKLTRPEVRERAAKDPAFAQMFLAAFPDSEKLLDLTTHIDVTDAQARTAIAQAEEAERKLREGPKAVKPPKNIDEISAAQAAKEGLEPGTPEYSKRYMELKSEYTKQYAEVEAARAGTIAERRTGATVTAATRTMKETAPKVRDLVIETEKALEAIKDRVGPGSSRLAAFTAGDIGAPDPDFITYADNAALLASLLQRMHVGARGGEYYDQKFSKMVGANKNSYENMKAALGVIRRYTDIVERKQEGEEIAPPPELESGVMTKPAATPTEPPTPTTPATAPSSTSAPKILTLDDL